MDADQKLSAQGEKTQPRRKHSLRRVLPREQAEADVEKGAKQARRRYLNRK
jgi:hypothetical protein